MLRQPSAGLRSELVSGGKLHLIEPSVHMGVEIAVGKRSELLLDLIPLSQRQEELAVYHSWSWRSLEQ